jgi:hypothetical protein
MNNTGYVGVAVGVGDVRRREKKYSMYKLEGGGGGER